ncbi:hypothetical protein Bbelb_142670 [Branchiostoma belcheri]|nr:hypothetical protein Bbelb_142670 [Branchiostoma belcheri]
MSGRELLRASYVAQVDSVRKRYSPRTDALRLPTFLHVDSTQKHKGDQFQASPTLGDKSSVIGRSLGRFIADRQTDCTAPLRPVPGIPDCYRRPTQTSSSAPGPTMPQENFDHGIMAFHDEIVQIESALSEAGSAKPDKSESIRLEPVWSEPAGPEHRQLPRGGVMITAVWFPTRHGLGLVRIRGDPADVPGRGARRPGIATRPSPRTSTRHRPWPVRPPV